MTDKFGKEDPKIAFSLGGVSAKLHERANDKFYISPEHDIKALPRAPHVPALPSGFKDSVDDAKFTDYMDALSNLPLTPDPPTKFDGKRIDRLPVFKITRGGNRVVPKVEPDHGSKFGDLP